MVWSTVDECDVSDDVTGYDVIVDHVTDENDVSGDEVDAAVDDDYEQLVLSPAGHVRLVMLFRFKTPLTLKINFELI